MKKHIIRRLFTAASMMLMTVVVSAQSASSAYFLEGFNQRYQLNPAFAPDRYVFAAIPGLSNIQVDFKSSVGLANFLYESKSKPGMLTTFMSPEIDSKTFLDGMPDKTRFNANLNMDLLALGIGGKRGFTTFNIKLKEQSQISIPKSMFGFMKAGMAQGNYLIEDLNVTSIAYLEASLTHSHKITDNLTIGLGLKFLDGAEYTDVSIDEIDARLSDESWKVKTNATINASIPAIQYTYKDDPDHAGRKTLEGTEEFEFSGESIPRSYGFAVDLGAEYDFKGLVDGLKVSASVTDLGFIKWDNLYTFRTDNKEYVEFNGFNNYKTGQDNDDAMDEISDDFKDMIKFYPETEGASKQITLDATFRVGAEYSLPMAKWISFGELITYKTGVWEYAESRTSICLSPCKWFDLTGNTTLSSMGSSMGLMLNLHPQGVNFFVAVDHLTADFNPQYVPLHEFGLDFSFGLNLAFGQKRN